MYIVKATWAKANGQTVTKVAAFQGKGFFDRPGLLTERSGRAIHRYPEVSVVPVSKKPRRNWYRTAFARDSSRESRRRALMILLICEAIGLLVTIAVFLLSDTLITSTVGLVLFILMGIVFIGGLAYLQR
jgi:hypothetical protein